ncbi:N-acetyltransferase [Bordetella genomosp. 10]|uniref:N-acetyltransferase n=2 Tax=Bordetella genomosp. 10 TaxID=1416804 RepID=A0A261S620_9BORD|nr:N-acetyltransferase [Bordetella genomosp. 10]
MGMEYKTFGETNLADPFFDSLKRDYVEFSDWYQRKAGGGERAYVFYSDEGALDGFLYLKREDDAVLDVVPPLAPARRIKIGTFKINAHGTRLGERFMKKIFDHAVEQGATQLYVTIFEHHGPLIQLFQTYGFRQVANKITPNGIEGLYLREIRNGYDGPMPSYPLVNVNGAQPYLLALYPEWHTRLLPDSILNNENLSIVQDVSHTNSIHKVYLGAIPGMSNLRVGDPIVIYRTSDNKGPAEYRSVATSLCVIEEYRHINSFIDLDSFLRYCAPYSVFTDAELIGFWEKRKYPHVLRFTYNIALHRRVTRQKLADEVGIDRAARWSLLPISDAQLCRIAQLGGIDESLIVH